jgi:hypothetical protein
MDRLSRPFLCDHGGVPLHPVTGDAQAREADPESDLFRGGVFARKPTFPNADGGSIREYPPPSAPSNMRGRQACQFVKLQFGRRTAQPGCD